MKNIDSKSLAELLAKAYKKLKSSIYFDKTQLILRDRIVDFESSIKNLDYYFKELATQIIDKNKFQKLEKEILQSIAVISFPKEFDQNSDCSNIITNGGLKELKIEELQYFIDMDVQGHILGVLWLMLIGYRIDKKIYEHSYGNRIRKTLYNEFSNEPTYSPYLFQPYFEQYESWRDTAMEKALKHLKNNQDVIILTMDFQRYYYSVDMNEYAFEKIFDEAFQDDDEGKNEALNKKLNDFVCSVVKKYSEYFDREKYDNRRILPIGFLPSNVIANWFLNNFDRAIIDGWNPIYFGRYVDDVLIVDKVEHNGIIYEKAKNSSLSFDDVINYYLIQCSKWQNLYGDSHCEKSTENGLFIKQTNDLNETIYQVNPKYIVSKNNKSKILLKKTKVNIFYFQSTESDALITCFRKNIAKNKSEFRHMPEDVSVFQKDDYSEIYHLRTNESPNKFRGIEDISVDKYELSKFLGKHLRIGGMIEDVVESKFEKDIHIIFNHKVAIENYLSWEKVIEIFVINERFEVAKKFIFNIINSIDKLIYNGKEEITDINSIKRNLYLHLYSSVNRAFALVWKKKCAEALAEIYEKFKEIKAFDLDDDINQKRRNYCETRMIDKYVMPLPIDMLEPKRLYSLDEDINLTHFYEVLNVTREKFKCEYIYYPYLITMYDFSMISAVEQFHSIDSSTPSIPFENLAEICKYQKGYYTYCNYNTTCEESSIETPIYISPIESFRNKVYKVYEVSVGNEKKNKLSVAIANVKVDHKNFENLIKGKPNRSYDRYKDISTLVNNAIDNKADMLIMPESFIPFEWLSTLARTCAKNDLAIITGIEHIPFKDKILNLTAVILPYKEGAYRCACISFHLKTHYAPSEKKDIRGYRYQEVEGKAYELYKWKNCFFPVYCCYELSSINDRALFQSYADFLVAIEWNKDINYYSNILESLSRDIHCYCIQVNSSDYGDSRITKPSKAEEKDMIRTKGGKNSTILIDTIDISTLRDFQIKEYELQKSDSRFKTTPPDFKADIVMKKIKGEDIIKDK